MSGFLSQQFKRDVNLSWTINFCLIETAKSIRKRRYDEADRSLKWYAEMTGKKKGMDAFLKTIKRLPDLISSIEEQARYSKAIREEVKQKMRGGGRGWTQESCD